MASRSELVEVRHDRFGFAVDAISDDAWGALWTNVHRAHLRWEAAGRP